MEVIVQLKVLELAGGNIHAHTYNEILLNTLRKINYICDLETFVKSSHITTVVCSFSKATNFVNRPKYKFTEINFTI